MFLAPLALLVLALLTLACALGYAALVNRIEAPCEQDEAYESWADVDASLAPEVAPMVRAAALGIAPLAWAIPDLLAHKLAQASFPNVVRLRTIPRMPRMSHRRVA